MHPQLQPLSPAENQMFRQCPLRTVYQEESILQYGQRVPETSGYKRVRRSSPWLLLDMIHPNIAPEGFSTPSRDRLVSPVTPAAMALHRITLLLPSPPMKAMIHTHKQVRTGGKGLSSRLTLPLRSGCNAPSSATKSPSNPKCSWAQSLYSARSGTEPTQREHHDRSWFHQPFGIWSLCLRGRQSWSTV